MAIYKWKVKEYEKGIKIGESQKVIGEKELLVEMDRIVISQNCYEADERETTFVIEETANLIYGSTNIRTDITKVLKKVLNGSGYKINYGEMCDSRLISINWTMPKNKLSFRK